jgi:hypothetical protein
VRVVLESIFLFVVLTSADSAIGGYIPMDLYRAQATGVDSTVPDTFEVVSKGQLALYGFGSVTGQYDHAFVWMANGALVDLNPTSSGLLHPRHMGPMARTKWAQVPEVQPGSLGMLFSGMVPALLSLICILTIYSASVVPGPTPQAGDNRPGMESLQGRIEPTPWSGAERRPLQLISTPPTRLLPTQLLTARMEPTKLEWFRPQTLLSSTQHSGVGLLIPWLTLTPATMRERSRRQ